MVNHGVIVDDATFNILNSKQFVTVKNVTYYSIDQGGVPDVVLTKIESFITVLN